MDGPGGVNWMVQTTESGRSWVKVDGPKDLKRTVLKSKSGRSKRKTLDGPKQENWAVLRVESRRFKKPEVDGPTGSKRKVQ